MQKTNWLTVNEFADKFDYFLFDCDGVLWYGSKQIGQAFRNIEYLESLGKKVFFVTNSSLISRETMAKKLTNAEFGYKNLKMDHLYPSATLSALYVKQKLPHCKKVKCIGMKPLKDELKSHGLEVVEDNLDRFSSGISSEQLDQIKIDPEVGAVVQGLDQAITYAKLAVASLYIQSGAKWITTNEDPHGVTAKGLRCPGNG